jgi:hypothetical protein
LTSLIPTLGERGRGKYQLLSQGRASSNDDAKSTSNKDYLESNGTKRERCEEEQHEHESHEQQEQREQEQHEQLEIDDRRGERR